MPPPIVCRRGGLEELRELKLSRDLSVGRESIEFNVVGMGHEFWIAVEGKRIVALTVIGRRTSNKLTIMYLQVADSYKSQGSRLLSSLIDNYPESEFTVIPFEGTEELY